jgi:putative ABC transport system ATP-binding protein
VTGTPATDLGGSGPAVAVTGVRFGWRAGPPVLAIDRLEVARGERVFVSGPSGSGKSTLLGLVGGVLVPQAGSVTVLGTDLATLSTARRDAFRASHIGFVFQLFNLLPYLSVVDNVVLPCRFSAARRLAAGDPPAEARRLLSQLGLADPALLARRVTELSVGQQQRVAAARALIGRPALVIADEPTSALDADTREDFLRLLLGECRAAGSTVLFVSHDRALAPLFDRRIALAEVNREATARA